MAVVSHGHVFGLKGDVKDVAHFLDDNVVLSAGADVVTILNTDTKEQKYIPGTEKCDGITALAVSPNRRLCAVAERGAERGVITIYDLNQTPIKKKRSLSPSDSVAEAYSSLSWSSDSKMLVALGCKPKHEVLVWNCDKWKVIGRFPAGPPGAAIYQASFQPQDNNVVCVTGDRVFALYRVVEGQDLKKLQVTMGKREAKNFTAHTWLSEDRLLVGTDAGDLILVDATEKGSVIPQPGCDHPISVIQPFTKGFVCGGGPGAIVTLYEPEEKETTLYKPRISLKIAAHPNATVASLAVSPSEEVLAVALDNQQLYGLPLANTDMMKPEENQFELIAQAFHAGPISGLDVCVRKPLVVTCGKDRTVRVWNYQEKTVEVMKTFAEEAHSVAFHPSGFHVLVGFGDKLRFCNILMDDIRPAKEFIIRGCRECRFSHGGHLFAAVAGNTIHVYSTYTFEMLGKLAGHNGKVWSVSWAADDSKLYSTGMDGAVYEWRLGKDFKRENENVLKTCSYTCVAATSDGRSCYAVGSDAKLKEISDGQLINEFPDEPSVAMTQVVLSSNGRVLFAGLANGRVRSYRLPLSEEPVMELCGHHGPVTRAAVTHDDSTLITGGEDGAIVMYHLRDRDGRAPKRDKDTMYAEEILITRSDVEEKGAMMTELSQRVDDLTNQNVYQLRLRDLKHSEEMKELREKYSAEREQERLKAERLLGDKNDAEVRHEEALRMLELKHQEELKELEKQKTDAIMDYVKQNKELKEEIEAKAAEQDRHIEEFEANHAFEIQQLDEEAQEQLHEMHLENEKLMSEKDQQREEFEATKQQIEEDADREIEQLTEQHQALLTEEKLQTLKAKGQAGLLSNDKERLQKRAEDREAKIRELKKERDREIAEKKALAKDIDSQKKEIRERDDTITEKETRIGILKRKNQELEKFKFVLDFKIKGLRAQIEPREKEIADMKVQIRDMDEELSVYKKNNDTLMLRISDLRLKLEGMSGEVAAQKKKISDRDAVIQRMRMDLHDVAQHIQDPKALKEKVKQVHARHAEGESQDAELDQGILKEYTRQREYLERSVESLRQKLAKDAKLHRTENTRIMQENVALIKEINELRREVKLLHMKRDQGGASYLPSSRARKLYPGHFPIDAVQLLDQQRQEILALKERIRKLEAGDLAARPVSRERPPPMEGFGVSSGGDDGGV